MENRDAAHDIVAERRRQIADEGYTLAHDDQYERGELLQAALAYIYVPGEGLWPWDAASYKPSTDPIRNLTKAGALLAAEVDRLKRCAERGQPVVGGMLFMGMHPDLILDTIDGLRHIQREILHHLKDDASA